jgi:hypothetical protein
MPFSGLLKVPQVAKSRPSAAKAALIMKKLRTV